MNISAVVLAKNEEKHIARCLESLPWCSEILVIDDDSTDTTSAIAKKHGAIVYQHRLNNDFSEQRNFGLQKAKNEWVLFVDADEVISEKLRNEIIQYTNNPINQYQGFYIKREDSMWGKVLRHGEQGNIKLLRLAKKNSDKWVGRVHEVWEVQGLTATLQNPLLHYPHPTIKEFLKEINYYSTLRVAELQEQGKSANWWSILLHAKGKFADDYFLKLGILDGIEGFLVAILMSFHAFLVRGKLWQLGKK